MPFLFCSYFCIYSDGKESNVECFMDFTETMMPPLSLTCWLCVKVWTLHSHPPNCDVLEILCFAMLRFQKKRDRSVCFSSHQPSLPLFRMSKEICMCIYLKHRMGFMVFSSPVLLFAHFVLDLPFKRANKRQKWACSWFKSWRTAALLPDLKDHTNGFSSFSHLLQIKSFHFGSDILAEIRQKYVFFTIMILNGFQGLYSITHTFSINETNVFCWKLAKLAKILGITCVLKVWWKFKCCFASWALPFPVFSIVLTVYSKE